MAHELKSLSRALEVLLAFSLERPLATVDELAHATGIPRSSLYKFLDNLERKGFVRHDPLARAYGPGVSLFRLGRVAAEGINLAGAASPLMRRLVDAAGESVYLSVRLGAERVCIDVAETPHGHIKYAVKPGATSPLHAGASGKVLLAFLPEGERAAVLRRLRLGPTAPRTITDRAELTRRLAEIRERGWDYSEEELAVGTWAFAAPVRDPDGDPVASLAIAGPLGRPDPARRQRLLPLLLRAVVAIEEAVWTGGRHGGRGRPAPG